MVGAPVVAQRPSAPVTVVVAAYQATSTIDQALASVAAQTVAPEAVLVADDASTDDTASLARSWADRLPLDVLTASANGGPAAARRRAVAAASTPLVALLDADDVWLPDHLETLLDVHAHHGGVALARFLRWAPGHGLAAQPADVAPVPPPEAQLRAFARGNFAWIATLFERATYERAGGFRSELRVGEEWDLYIRMVRQGVAIHRAGHPTALYRIRQGSLMWDDAGVDDRVRVLELACAEALDGHERRAFAAGARRLRAERALLRSYALASDGRPGAARLAALGTWSGSRRVLTRGAGMVALPTATEARRRRARATPVERLQA